MAQRHARARGVPWYTVYLELWDDQKESRTASRNRALEQVALAERMGAITFTTKAADYVRGFHEVLAECTRRNVNPALVVISGINAMSSSAARRFVATMDQACNGRCELLSVVPAEEYRKRMNWLERLHMRRLTLPDVIWSMVAVGGAYVVTHLMQWLMPDSTVLEYTHTFLIYLIACATVAGHRGLLPGLIATVTSFVLINWFILPPIHSLRVENLEDSISLGLFLITASIISVINSKVYTQAESSEINEWRMQALLQVYKIALHAKSREEALEDLHNNLQQFLHAEIVVYLPSVVTPTNLQAVWPANPTLDANDFEILNGCWEESLAGRDTDSYNPDSGWWFEPLSSAKGELGMLAVRVPAAESTDVTFERYLRTIAELVASILEKMESVGIREESRVRDEREKLRTNLLSSVSHDLKTPLAAILGSLSVHRSMYDKLPEAQRKELTEAALTEAQRLDSFITNILDLAKMESGAVKFKREWQTPEDLVGRVKKRLRLRLGNRAIIFHAPENNIEIELDPVTSEQALLNIIDNAVKYTPPESAIEIRVQPLNGKLQLHVRDHGLGIPKEAQERIFDKYTRLQRQDSQVAGTGLGLAVARAAMRGQHGEITVANHESGGAEFILCWPSWRTVSRPGGMRGSSSNAA
jgi:two-component system sensor histidine kinase KdpD